MPTANIIRTSKTQRARLAGFGVVWSLVFALSFNYFISPALAVAPPTFFSYQGRILDDAGAPIADATASIIFRIYDGPDTGSDTCLWSNSSASCATATAATITLSDGLFSENLGDTSDGYAAVNESVFADNATLYLAVTINGEALTPLKRITSQGFAINSSLLDGLNSSSSGGTSSFVPVTGSNGNLILTGDPQGSGVSQGALYVNPAAPAADETIFGAANNGTSVFRVDAEGDAALAGNLTVSGTTFSAAAMTTFNCSDCIDGDDLADTLTLDAATAFALGANNLTIAGSGTGDFLISPDADTNIQITATAAPTADMIAISNAAFAATTDGVAGLSIAFSASNESGFGFSLTPSYSGNGSDTFTALNIAGFTSTTSGGTDTVNGINLGNLTEAGAGVTTSTGLSIGTGWDTAISSTGFSITGGGAVSLTPNSDTDALTVTGTNVAGNNLLALTPFNTSGTLIASAYASSTTQSGALVGLDMDLSTNVTGANGADVTGIRATTVGGTRTGTGTEIYSGFTAASGSALTQNTAVGVLGWRGYTATIPTITQTTGTVTADGVLINFPVSGAIVTGGTSSGIRIVPPSTSGPAAGTLIGVNIGDLTSAGTGTETAIAIGAGWDQQISASGFLVTGTGTTTITPGNDSDALTITGTNVAGNNLIALTPANTSGTLIASVYGSSTTQAGALIGLDMDLSTNVLGSNGYDITGIRSTTAGGTRTGTGAEIYTSFLATSGAALTQSTAVGVLGWRGYTATIPEVTQTTGSVTADGVLITFPVSNAITTGGNSSGLHIIPPSTSGPDAGNLTGIKIGNLISAGGGTEEAITIGSGWDTAISVNGAQMTVAVTGVVAIGLDNTATTSGLCHSGSDVDVATNVTRDIVACSMAPDDYAEWYDSDGTPTAGDVVALTDDTITFAASQSNPYTGQIVGTIQKTLPIISQATSASGNRTFGIISTSPIQVIGSDIKRQGSHPVPVALSGRVPLHVSDENGAIAPGDPLTASSTAGYAMKANPGDLVIAAALGSFESGQGTIQAFVRFGAGTASDVSAAENTATMASDSSMGSLNMNGNIYMNGNSIISVANIEGIGGRWSINEDGVFSTQSTYQAQIATTQGDRATFYSTMSPEVSLTLSGTSELAGGRAKIRFADVNPDFGGSISTVAPIRVLVTANGPTGYLYVSEKDNNGFAVQELGDSTSGVSFDWLVIAYRNGYEPEETLEIETPIVEDTTTDVADPIAETEIFETPPEEVAVPTIEESTEIIIEEITEPSQPVDVELSEPQTEN